MGLYDIIDDIAEKQIIKTETGDNRIFGVILGIVTDIDDPSGKGRVCVQVPVRDKEENVLQWARVAMPSSGKGWGHYFHPEIGDQVLLAFEQGNIEKPYIIGCIPRDNDKFLKKSYNKDNEIKQITTKHGSTIKFFDSKDDEDGAKDSIQIVTAGNQHEFIMDNDKKLMVLRDKEKENSITINTEKGTMDVKIKDKVTIKVGDNITVTMNGADGAVKIDCTKATVKGSSDIKIESDGSTKVAGGNVSVQANTALKASSSGTVKIEGTPISIG